MKKTGLLSILIVMVLLAAPVIAQAQQLNKVPRIGILTPDPVSARASQFEGFEQGLRELGYVEGQNIAIEWRCGDETACQLILTVEDQAVARRAFTRMLASRG